MSASESVARRGRPPEYDWNEAMGSALDIFRKKGFSATSLDDLSAATGMNRPSIYGAFGNKCEFYFKCYLYYRDYLRRRVMVGPLRKHALRKHELLREQLNRIFSTALDLYLEGDSPRGCFIIMTAMSEQISDHNIRTVVSEDIFELDRIFVSCFHSAWATGLISDPIALGHLAAATLHSLAIRARAGASRSSLEEIISGALDVMCK